MEQNTLTAIYCSMCSLQQLKSTDVKDLYVCCQCGNGQLVVLSPACFNCGHIFQSHHPISSSSQKFSSFQPNQPAYSSFNQNLAVQDTTNVNEILSHGTITVETTPAMPLTMEDESWVEFGNQQIQAFSQPAYDTDTMQKDHASTATDTDEYDLGSSNADTQSTSSTSLTPLEDTAQDLVDSVMRSDYIKTALQNFIANIQRTANHTKNDDNSTNTEVSQDRTASSSSQASPANAVRHCIQENKPLPSDGDDNGDSSSDDNSDDRKNPGKSNKSDGSPKKPLRKLACPYFRYDPNAFVQENCAGPGWPNVHRLKYVITSSTLILVLTENRAHLYRRHRLYQCDRCYEPFRSAELLTEHHRQRRRCKRRREPHIDPSYGFKKAQEDELKSRKRYSKMSEVEKWETIYMILFPTENPNQIPPACKHENT
jgi:hypothetical protein